MEDRDMAALYVSRRRMLGKLTTESVQKYRYALEAFLQPMHRSGRTLSNVTEDDALFMIGTCQDLKSIDGSDLGEYSRHDYWRYWKGFCKYVHERHGVRWDPAALKLIMEYTYKIDRNKSIPKSTFTRQECALVFKHENSFPWHTFWLFICDTGPRISEARGVLVRDVQEHEDGTVSVYLRGKTGPRTVFAFGTTADSLRRWMMLHPWRDNPDHKFFLNSKLTPISEKAAEVRLKELVAASGLHKVRPCLHGLRASAATNDAEYLSDEVLCKKFGWVPGSPMPARYIRQSSIDLKAAELRARSRENPRVVPALDRQG